MDLSAVQLRQGARLAADSIPLDFGDQAAEYQAALETAILLDRSHEARLALRGQSALDLIYRISTNDLNGLGLNQGRPTILTNATGRIIDRIIVYQCEDQILVLGEPGRDPALSNYLQRNIFYGDDVQLSNLTASTRALDLHGPAASRVLQALYPECASLPVFTGHETGTSIYVARRDPVIEQRWTLVVPNDQAADLWLRLSQAGAAPAGSLIYNVLRVRAGLPSVGRELSENFIPLEVGLWDEVSFSKGCYTGQEIIARMESRHRLAKTLVTLKLNASVEPPADIYVSGRRAGQLTSCVTAPDGEIFALAVIKPEFAHEGQTLEIGDEKTPAQVQALAGSQPKLTNLS